MLGHLVAHGDLPDSALGKLLARPKLLVELLANLLHSPGAEAAAAGYRSLRDVETDTHKSAEGAVAAALDAALGEAGLHGARRHLLAADVACTAGHLSGLPQAAAAFDGLDRLLPGLLQLLQDGRGPDPVAPVLLENVLTALGGLTAYCPGIQAQLADLAEEEGQNGNAFREAMAEFLDVKQPLLIQVGRLCGVAFACSWRGRALGRGTVRKWRGCRVQTRAVLLCGEANASSRGEQRLLLGRTQSLKTGHLGQLPPSSIGHPPVCITFLLFSCPLHDDRRHTAQRQ